VTKENLAVIDRQIAAASTATSKKSKKRLSEPEIERNVKKQKVDHSETKVVLHKPKVIITYGRADKRGPMSSTPQKPPRRTRSGNVTQEQERVLLDLRGFNKRGPTTSGPQSPPQKTYSENVRQEQAKVILDLRGQPRSNNGRFAKKSKISSIPPVQNKNVSFPASSQKRKNEEMEDFQESPRKKSAYADKDDEVVPTIQKVIARRASGFHGGRLFSKPNPQQFALKAWSKIMVPEDSSVSSEDEGDLATPEDNFPSRANIVDPGEAEMINRFSTRASLSCINPSPLAFAKNRWNSFGQTIATPKSRLSLDELYVSEAEVSVLSQSACHLTRVDLVYFSPRWKLSVIPRHHRMMIHPTMNPFRPIIDRRIQFSPPLLFICLASQRAHDFSPPARKRKPPLSMLAGMTHLTPRNLEQTIFILIALS
jgi:histone-lysine N-methyltransferase SUV420H